MEKKTKIYCGSGKKRNDTWLSITINPDKIKDYIQEYNGSKFIKLNINLLNEPDKFGKDVQVSVDTWKQEESEFKQKPDKKFTHDNTPLNDLPF
jgi:hypothetical protein